MRKGISNKGVVFVLFSFLIIIAGIGFFLKSTSAQGGGAALDGVIATGKSQLFTKTLPGGLDAYKTFQAAVDSPDYASALNAQKVKIRTYLAVTRMLDVLFRDDGGTEADTLAKLLAKYGITRTGNDFESLNAYPQKDRYGNIIIPATAPDSEAVRAFLAGPFLTAVNASIADMDDVVALLGQTETKEIISKNLTNNDKDIEVDDGDYYLFRAVFKAMKFAALTLSAYNTNVNPRELMSLVHFVADGSAMRDILDRYPDLLKLAAGSPDGPQRLAQAKEALIGAIDDYLTASEKIRNDADVTPGAEKLFSITEDEDLYREGLLRENMATARSSLTENKAVTFIEKRIGTEYHVYGGASYSTTEPYHWEKGYHPERYGYTYLGKADKTATFNGQYNCYIIMTRAGNMAPVDAVQGSGGVYYSTDTTGNTINHWNLNGASDGNYALVGGRESGAYGGFVVIRPPSAITSLTVYLASAPGVVPIETYGQSRANLYPLFGDVSKAPLQPRDLLPQISNAGVFTTGTMGHGLLPANDATLGGLLPDHTQDKWAKDYDSLQPTGSVTIPTATIDVQDGQSTDWGSISPVFTDITGETQGPAYSDFRELYLAKDDNHLYIRMDMAGAIPQADSTQLTYILNLKKNPGPDMPGDVQIHVSYYPWLTPAWQASIVKKGVYGNYYQVAQLPASSFQIFGNTIEIAAPLAQAGEIGGRFIAVTTQQGWGPPLDNNHTGLQITPTASVTGALTVPQYDGTGLIHLGVFPYDGAYDTDPQKRLGGAVIYPGQYSGGMSYTVADLPLGVDVFVAAFWDKDMTGARTAGDVFARTDFFQTGQTNPGKDLNTSPSPVITTGADPQFVNAAIYKESRYANNDAASTKTTYYVSAVISGVSPGDATVAVTGPNGFQQTLAPENIFSLNSHVLALYYLTETPLADGNYKFTLLDASGRVAARRYCWFSSSVNVPATPDISSFQINGVSMTKSGNNYVSYIQSSPVSLSWSPADGAQGYQVIVRSWKGDVALVLPTQSTSVTLPAGTGQPNTPYRFQVRALDSMQSPQARARSKEAWFYTGPAASADPVNISYASVYFLNEGSRKFVWMGVRIPGVAPWDVQSLTVSCPDGTTWPDGTSTSKAFNITPYSGIGSRPDEPYYELSLPDPATPPANGTYTFTVTDKSGRTGSKTATFTYNPITGVDNTTMSPISNAYTDTTTPTFSWAAAPGNPTYILRIFDYNGSAFSYQAQTTATSHQIPAGLLKNGGTYRWRVHIADANGNQTNTEKRPITILPATTGGSISGRISRNTGQTGLVRVTLANLKGAAYSQQVTLGAEWWNDWFNFTNVPDGNYMISAYMDVNGNNQYDAGEPYGYYRTETGVREVIIMNRQVQGSDIWIELKDPAQGETGISGKISSTLPQAVTGHVAMFRTGDTIRDYYSWTVPGLGKSRPPGGSFGLDILANKDYAATKINAPPGGMPMAEGVYDVVFMTGQSDFTAKTGSQIFHQRYDNIVVNRGALTGNINFAVSSGAVLGGSVTESGAPVDKVQVILFTGGPVFKLAGSAFTDASGSYSFSCVPIGDYTLAVFINGVKKAVVPVSITSPAAAVTTKDVAVSPPVMGDLNNDTLVNLADAILALQVTAGRQPGVRGDYTTVSGVDVNGDAKIGLQEAIYILQTAASLRQ